jgi:rhodanese-related sulfurtransferase/DNA-directed RNA polymerase subunit RPC12/RpoP
MKLTATLLKVTTLALIVFVSVQSTRPSHLHESSVQPKDEYVCLPCGNDCDTTVYTEPGTCPSCNMPLVKRSTVNIKNIQPTEICNYIASHPGIVLLDVRTKEEYEGKATPDYGTLNNAINIPLQELKVKLPTISSLKDRQIIVYCSHSHRSPQATYLLMQNGFTKVMNMAGGMSVMKDNSCKTTPK